MTRTAWFCPSCQKHHGPHVDTCPGPAIAAPIPVVPYVMPVYTVPRWNDPVTPPWQNPVIGTWSCTSVADPRLILVN